MATHQKTSGSETSRHGGGLRTIFDKFRTTKRPPPLDLTSNKRSSTVQVIPSISTQKSQDRLRYKKYEKNGRASGDVKQDTPSFFSKLLRRQTRSKKQPETSEESQTTPSREQRVKAYEDLPRHRDKSRQTTHDCTASSSSQRGYSRIDAKINAGENKRQSQVYVPTHAAADAAYVPVSHSLKDRYSTLIDDDEAKRLSQMLAQLSPPAEADDSRPQSYFSDDCFRDEQRRLTVATLEGSNVDSESSFGFNETSMNNTLQPPPTPTRRRQSRQKRQSHPFSDDHHQISEEPEEPSDYQRFVQQALERDRHESDEMWHAIISRAADKNKNRNLAPNPPDLVNARPLQRSGTFGGGRKERSVSMKRDDAWKRSSHYSHQADGRKRQSYYGGDTDLGLESPQKDLRRKTTAARRLSDYFKPPREVPGSEQSDNKRFSSATFR